jgi:hypothetical protein
MANYVALSVAAQHLDMKQATLLRMIAAGTLTGYVDWTEVEKTLIPTRPPPMTSQQEWSTAVVTVGDGRGFVIEHDAARYVITAAHCLPHLPPANLASYQWERTYGKLLAPVGGEPAVWAECLFVDPIGDIAVLGQPDDQALPDEADGYDELVDNAVPLPVGDLVFTRRPSKMKGNPREPWEAHAEVFLLTLRGRWISAQASSLGITRPGHTLWFDPDPTEGGMSGSPIVTADGKAVGVVGSSAVNSLLMAVLPGWLICR